MFNIFIITNVPYSCTDLKLFSYGIVLINRDYNTRQPLHNSCIAGPAASTVALNSW